MKIDLLLTLPEWLWKIFLILEFLLSYNQQTLKQEQLIV